LANNLNILDQIVELSWGFLFERILAQKVGTLTRQIRLNEHEARKEAKIPRSTAVIPVQPQSWIRHVAEHVAAECHCPQRGAT
jgi:hypothetical protein